MSATAIADRILMHDISNNSLHVESVSTRKRPNIAYELHHWISKAKRTTHNIFHLSWIGSLYLQLLVLRLSSAPTTISNTKRQRWHLYLPHLEAQLVSLHGSRHGPRRGRRCHQGVTQQVVACRRAVRMRRTTAHGLTVSSGTVPGPATRH